MTIERGIFHSADSKLNLNSWYKRLSSYLVLGVLDYKINSAAGTTKHEIEHAKVANDYGLNPILGVEFDDGTQNDNLSAGELFFELLTHTDIDNAHIILDNMNSPEINAKISAAGINGQTQFAQDIALEGIKNNWFHVSDSIAYGLNKIEGLTYEYFSDPNSSRNDLENYIENLQNQGFKISRSDLRRYQAISLLSSGTINYVNSFFNYVINGEEFSDPLNLELNKENSISVYFPEVSTRMNYDNVALRIDLPIGYDGMIITPSVEKSVKGNEFSRYGINISKRSGVGKRNSKKPVITEFEIGMEYNERLNTFDGVSKLTVSFGHLDLGIEAKTTTEEDLMYQHINKTNDIVNKRTNNFHASIGYRFF